MGPGIVPARLQFKYSKKQNVDPCKLEKSLFLDAEGLEISVAGLSLEDLSLEPTLPGDYHARRRSGEALI